MMALMACVGLLCPLIMYLSISSIKSESVS
nr:MAG TPA: hypothetical protein [Caudoviricetes sp.]